MNKGIRRRLFVGIPIVDVRHELLGFRARYLDSFSVRWIREEDWHVTLVPPWYAIEDDVPKIIERLSLVTFQPFEMEFYRVAYGPRIRDPRLIWLEGSSSSALLDLKRSIENVLGIQGEQRPFHPHITLARFRAESFREFSVQTLEESVRWREKVRTFALYESHLSPKGAEYEVLKLFRV